MNKGIIIHDPELQQINFLDDRFYKFEGPEETLWYPSVTNILGSYPKGQQFQEWLKQVGFNAGEIASKAAESGSKIHNAIDTYLKGFNLTWCDLETGRALYTLEEWKQIGKFVEFWEKEKPTILTNETAVCSHEYKYAGTVDLVCELRGQVYMIDIKTGNYLHKENELQLAAYATAWNELNPDYPIEHTAVFHTKAATRSEGKGNNIQGAGWKLEQFSRERPYQDAFKLFFYIHEIWKEENPNAKPANLILPDHYTHAQLSTNKVNLSVPEEVVLSTQREKSPKKTAKKAPLK
jgi:PD-(D/E)XK nuclease superfamily